MSEIYNFFYFFEKKTTFDLNYSDGHFCFNKTLFMLYNGFFLDGVAENKSTALKSKQPQMQWELQNDVLRLCTYFEALISVFTNSMGQGVAVLLACTTPSGKNILLHKEGLVKTYVPITLFHMMGVVFHHPSFLYSVRIIICIYVNTCLNTGIQWKHKYINAKSCTI